MSSTIDTAKVTNRRQLHFDCLEDIRNDVEQLAKRKEVRSLGNWSAGQILTHLSVAMNGSIDDTIPKLPGIVRFLLRLFIKHKMLNKPMTAGFHLPNKAAAVLIPPPTNWEEGLRNFRQAMQRLITEPMRAPSPVVGPMTNEEWVKLHCRHAELHLSFLIPSS